LKTAKGHAARTSWGAARLSCLWFLPLPGDPRRTCFSITTDEGQLPPRSQNVIKTKRNQSFMEFPAIIPILPAGEHPARIPPAQRSAPSAAPANLQQN